MYFCPGHGPAVRMGTGPMFSTVVVKHSVSPNGTPTTRFISPCQSMSPPVTSARGLPPSWMVSVEETTTRLPILSSASP